MDNMSEILEFVDSVHYQGEEPLSKAVKSKATLTSQLAKKMAACKQAMAETIRELAVAGKLADKKHDQAADMVKDLDTQIEANPDNEELHTRRDEYDRVRGALNATSEYNKGLHEQITGTPRKEPQRHELRDAGNRFTKKGSLGQKLRELMQGES